MADPQSSQNPVTEWDAQGKPVGGPAEWDASGKPITPSPASGVMTEQSEHARQTAPARPVDASILSRFGQAVGFPTSMDEWKQFPAAVGKSLIGPGGTGPIGGYLKNLYDAATAPGPLPTMTPAEQNDTTHPVGHIVSQGTRYLLDNALPGGQGLSNMAEDVSKHHYGPAAGDLFGTILNVLTAEKGMGPTRQQRLYSLTHAAGDKGAREWMSTIDNLLNTRDASGAKVNTIGDAKDIVNKFKDNVNSEYYGALGPYANRQILPLNANGLPAISERIRALKDKYPNIDASDRAAKAAIDRAAVDYEKPITIGELDRKRTILSTETAKHAAKEPVARYEAKMGNVNLAIDNAILDALRDEVYPRVDAMAGKPTGYFENLKGQQSNAMRLESLLNTSAKNLLDTSYGAKGTPPMARMHGGGYVSATGPHAYLSGLKNAVSPRDVLEEANNAAAKGFSRGNPVSKALMMSYPARFLALSNQDLTPVDQQK